MSITVEATISSNVGEIRFAKPPFNFACPELLKQIADHVDAFDADANVRAILLSADGKNFCAGADLAGDESITKSDGMASIGELYVQATRLFSRKKPIVAAVQGGAIGAGLGLGVCADFRVAGPGTRFAANFTRLGFHPGFGLTHTLPRLIGSQKARWMFLSSERVKPDAALAWGLADRLADSDENIQEAAMHMAQEIAENAPLALISTRATMTSDLVPSVVAAMKHEHAEQSALKQTADYAEGVASVFERRAAKFIGQ